MTLTHAIFIDPSSEHFLNDRLFDIADPALNRDGTLLPFFRLKAHFAKLGIPVHTADKLRNGSIYAENNHYWSLGLMNGHQTFVGRSDVRLRGFIMLEPPLVDAEMYAALPSLTATFETVHLHNIHGHCYSLDGVTQNHLRKLSWPQPFCDVIPEFWERTDRKNKLVAIAGNHNPGSGKPEYYSLRIEAIAALSGVKGIDLYGRGWDRWWSKQSAWWPYWRHRLALIRSYYGSCNSKWETLSQYRFSLCFENMPMQGYLTEKLFDCLYAGTVPVYLGAPDIEDLVPSEVFIDMRKFKSYRDMLCAITQMSQDQWQSKREAAREFLKTQGANEYHNSLLRIITI